MTFFVTLPAKKAQNAGDVTEISTLPTLETINTEDMRKLFLLSTAHLEDCLWFRDDEDFRVAMNYIAIQAASCPEVIVLAFILMSNHVHFVLMGREEDVIAFVNGFKHRYSLYYNKKYGTRKFLRHNALDVKAISFEDEAPERVIAYVQMNCVAANICSHPSLYPWGTGSSFFSLVERSGKRLGELSARERGRLMHSESASLPDDWIIGEDGYILPASYVAYKRVESLYRTPNRMQYFLNGSSKAQKRLGLSEDNLPAFRDQTILATLNDLCRSLFQKDSFWQLSPEQQREFARQIRFRFSADAHQIARVCGISYAEAARLLDEV